ncbi:epithelial-stromal interaction protein 1 isoform X1 [Alosa pseudoharengus]|uniref:epithelial-stromal interaction protein 1 isoform X1 n=2 Tax=Alosa pseudoharengus TaxID=34774 RepID=UPI003F88FFFF
MDQNNDTGDRFQDIGQNKTPEGSGNLQTPSRDATPCAGGVTMIPPNESRRQKLLRMAQKGEDDLRRIKEENKHGPVQIHPERLGGCTAVVDVRQKQQMELRQAGPQKKLRREELKKKKRQAEEEEILIKKAIQREKADKLEKKRQQEDQKRAEMYRHDHLMKQEQLLQRVEQTRLPSVEAGRSVPASSGNVMSVGTVKGDEEREQELRMEHRRANLAFLDRLQAGATNTEQAFGTQYGGCQLKQEPQEDAVLSLEHIRTNTKEEFDADLDWVVMRLLSHFPHYEKAFVEDIVSQCNGDFQQAYNLFS